MRRFVWCLAAAVTACGGGVATEWEGTERDSAGVLIVDNTESGVWSDDERWSVTGDLVIGSAEGDPDYQFGAVSAVGVMSDGRIVALDNQAQHVKVFTPDGTYDTQFGGPGSGPGELGRGASFLMVMPGDTILVADLANQRVNRYGPDGAEAGSFRLGFEDGIPIRFEVTADGAIASQMRSFQFTPDQPEPDSLDYIVKRSATGEVLDTIIGIERGETFSQNSMKLFSPEPIWALYGTGVLLARNDEYRITRRTSAGEVDLIFTMPRVPQELPDQDEETFREAIMRLFRRQGLPPEAMQRLEQIISFADDYPVFAQVQGGPGGTVWVQHIQRAAELTEEQREAFNPQLDIASATWDVFDDTGRFLGNVDFPERFTLMIFDGDNAYGVWRDDLDVQYVMKARIDTHRGDTGAIELGEG